MLEIFIYDFFRYLLPFFLIINIIGIISYPISNLIFKSNFDKGYVNSQIIGILGIGWLSFITGIIISQIFGKLTFPLFIPTLIISILVWALINYKIYRINKHKNFEILFRDNKKKIFSSALIQSFFLLLIYFLHSFNYIYTPIGTENQMNLGILNSINYSNTLPPEDMWFSKTYLNYYYFGHYLVALISFILNLNPSRDFLFLSSILPSLFLTSGSILILTLLKDTSYKLSNLKIFLTVMVSTLFLLFISPIKTLMPLFDLIKGDTTMPEILKSYHLFSIRILPNLIVENFNYAILVNPLHALTSNLMVGVLILNCIYLIYKSSHKINITNRYLVAVFIFIGFSGLINTWDLVFYFCLTFLALIVFKYDLIIQTPKEHLKNLILLFVPIIIIIAPWFYFFISPAGLIGLNTKVSNLFDLFYFWGIYIIIFIFFLFYKNREFKIKNFLLFLAIFGFATLLFVEMFYFKDSLQNTDYYRANTYYKFGNLALLIFSFCFATFLSYLLLNKRNVYFTTAVLILVTVSTWFNYPLLLVKSRELKYTGHLDQSLLVSNFSPELLEVIQYLNENKTSDLVILEGSRNSSYSETNFVSVFTGIPTVFGWRDHELTWRNNKLLLPEALEREKDVSEIYTTSDLSLVVNLIKKYEIDYIVISKSERNIYQNELNEENLLQTGEVVYDKNRTKLIKVKNY